MLLRCARSAAPLLLVLVSCATPEAQAPASRHDQAAAIAAQVRRADYEGDRAALRRHFDALAPLAADVSIRARVHYWRGFAMWRRAINGFNDDAPPAELAGDLAQSLDAFESAAAADPAFVDARIGMLSVLGYQAYMSRGDAARMQQLFPRIRALAADVQKAAPENPRMLWVMGPILWNTPAAQGGGADRAIATYRKGLDAARKESALPRDALEPAWGEPELLMSLAYSYLNASPPDVPTAERSAREALAQVPYWHYVRDILLPQIERKR